MSQGNVFASFAENWSADATFLSTPTGEHYTYADLLTRSGQVVTTLSALGAEPGDRVSVQAEKSVDYVWLFLGCLRGGFVFHPLNPAYTANELEYFFDDASPRIVVADGEATSNALEVAKRCGVPQTLTMGSNGDGSFRQAYAQAESSESTYVAGENDIAALLYSSGTTGQPKGIPLTHENIRVNARELSAAWGFHADDVLLHALPMFHTHGLFIALNCTLMTGSAVRYLNRFDPDTVIDEMGNSTVMMGVPTYYTRLLASQRLNDQAASAIRLFTSGSAPLREDTFYAFESRTGQRILERYGMTETIILTSNPLQGDRRAGTVGITLPSVSLRIANDDDRALPPGEIGRIQVRGPSVFAEYWRKPDKTAEDFTTDGYFNTGDQGRIDDDGYVSIVGRAKDLIISGGLNVYPTEVEQVLNEYDGVIESAVIGAPHADFGEGVIAAITAEPAFSEASIKAYVAERLANFKRPKKYFVLDNLPRNAMGKVQKNVLRDRFRDVFDEP